MPALVVNYFGQGSPCCCSQPETVENPFFMMAPKPGPTLPLVFVLATAATVIASQALITAAFSVTKQAIQTWPAAAHAHPAHLSA